MNKKSPDKATIDKAFNKLLAYTDTGLTPEELARNRRILENYNRSHQHDYDKNEDIEW